MKRAQNIRSGGGLIVILLAVGIVSVLPVAGDAVDASEQRSERARALSAPVPTSLVADAADRAIGWAQSQASQTFAGAWYRSPGDQTLVLAFTQGSDDYAASLKGLVGTAPFEVVSRAYSWQELRALQTRVDSDRDALAVEGIEVTSTGVVPNRNVVRIGIRRLDDRARRILTARYGSEMIAFEERDYALPAHRSFEPPWPGGMPIFGECDSSDCFFADCTSGFVVFEEGLLGKEYSQLTAGHCFPNGALIFTHVWTPGRVVERNWANGWMRTFRSSRSMVTTARDLGRR